MRTSMLGISFRLSVTNRSRMLASIASVAVAIALLVSMSLLLANMESSYKQQLADVFGGVDVIVTPPTISVRYFNPSDQENITQLKKVKQASFVLINPVEGEELFLIGLQNDELAKARYRFTEDLLQDEVIITDSLASRLNVKQGASVELPLNYISRKHWTVKEIIADVNVTAFPDLVYMNLEALQRSSGHDGLVSGAMLDLADGVEPLSLIRLIERTIQAPVAYQLVTDSDLAKRNAESMRWISSIVTLATLLASLAIVLSNFRLMLQSIVRPITILHANGATKKQLFSIVLYQLAAVVICGSLIGGALAAVLSLLGAGLLERLFSLGNTSYTFYWKLLLIDMMKYAAMLFIVLLPLLARGFFKLPIEYRAAVMNKERGVSKSLQYAAGLMLAISIVVVIIAVLNEKQIFSPLAGALFACGLWLALPPCFHSWLDWRIRRGLRSKQKEKVIALQYLALYFKQNMLIIFAISVSINVPVIGYTIFDSAKKANINIVNEEFVADIHLYNNSITVALPDNAVADIAGIPGVQSVIPVSQDDWATVINIKGVTEEERYHQLYYKKSNLQQLIDKGLIPPIQHDLTQSVILTKDYAKELGVSVGDKLTLIDPERKNEPIGNLQITAIVDGYLPGSMSLKTVAYVDADHSIVGADPESPVGSRARAWNTLLIDIEEEQRASIYEELQAYASFYTSIRFGDKQLALHEMEQFVHQRFMFLYAIIAVTLLVSAIGIYYTMHAFVNQRRKEFAILFSLGMTFKQVRRMLVHQLSMFCIVASLTGIATSVVISSTLLLAMESPIISLSWSFMLSLTLGIVAFGGLLAYRLARPLRGLSIPQLLTS